MSIELTLPPDLQSFVEEQVKNRCFSSADELMVRAVRELKAKHDLLMRFIQPALDEIARGDVGPLDLDEVLREALAEAARLRALKGAA